MENNYLGYFQRWSIIPKQNYIWEKTKIIAGAVNLFSIHTGCRKMAAYIHKNSKKSSLRNCQINLTYNTRPHQQRPWSNQDISDGSNDPVFKMHLTSQHNIWKIMLYLQNITGKQTIIFPYKNETEIERNPIITRSYLHWTHLLEKRTSHTQETFKMMKNRCIIQ